MAHATLPQEELQPLIESMKMVFEPFLNVMPDIAKIPTEVDRLINVISQDVKSGQGKRFEDGSKKSVDMIQMMKDFNEKNSPEAKKRAEELAKLEKIAQERQKAEADLQKLQQLGTPAEITEDNKVKILNEKEILEKQKEYIKEQKEVTFLEKQIEEEKGKGEDADSERLLILKEALDKQNQLLEEQGQVLGDRLPRQKVKEGKKLGARDFIPDPLMEVFDTVGPELVNVKDSILSFAKPFTGTFKFLSSLFKKRGNEEEEYIDDLKERAEGEVKTAKEVGKTALKMIALTVAIVGAIAGFIYLGKQLYKLAKIIADPMSLLRGEELPENLQRKSLGMFTEESDDAYKERLMTEEGLSAVEAGKIVRANTNEFDNPMARLFNDSRYGDEKAEIAKDQRTDFLNKVFGAGGTGIGISADKLATIGGTSGPSTTVIIKKDGDNNNIVTDNSASRAGNPTDLAVGGGG